MKIRTILHQHRRDFTAIYECENCGALVEDDGYDDVDFHNNVIPSFICPSCGESIITLGVEYRPLAPKYPEGYEV